MNGFGENQASRGWCGQGKREEGGQENERRKGYVYRLRERIFNSEDLNPRPFRFCAAPLCPANPLFGSPVLLSCPRSTHQSR
eukprot:126011-Chlamydomonas_euryale.AAC.1